MELTVQETFIFFIRCTWVDPKIYKAVRTSRYSCLQTDASKHGASVIGSGLEWLEGDIFLDFFIALPTQTDSNSSKSYKGDAFLLQPFNTTPTHLSSLTFLYLAAEVSPIY